MRRLGTVLSLGLLASSLLGQSANTERGLSGESGYHLGDVDAVHAWNGGLSLRIGVGPSFPVNGLSYGLVARYSSLVWEKDRLSGGTITYSPEPFSNAGFGWTLDLSRIHPPGDSPFNDDSSRWMLREADGTKRLFHERLHPGDPASIEYRYSRDGSYLRLRCTPNCSSGQSSSVTELRVESRDGTVRRYNGSGRVIEIADRFGNALSVGYASTAWVLSDSYRTHTVIFGTGSSPACSGSQGAAGQVNRVEVAAFGGTKATYCFDYETALVDNPDGVSQESVSLLRSITLPDGSTWEMSYEASNPSVPEAAGALTSLTLPTDGRYEYAYTTYTFDFDGVPTSAGAGVGTKSSFHARTATPLGTWSYSRPELVSRRITSPSGDDTVLFFDPAGVPGAVGRSDPLGGRLLASRQYEGAFDPADPSKNLVRTQYVGNARDPSPGTTTPHNLRLLSQRTVYHDDGDRWTSVELSDYDGFGNARTQTTGGNFGVRDVRRTFRNFNADRGTYTCDSTGSCPGSSYTAMPTSEPWILNTFHEEEVTEGATTYKRELCFEGIDPSVGDFRSSTGFLTRERVLAGSSRGGTDVLRAFTKGSRGNVTRERHYGAGGPALPTGGHVCGLTLPTATDYELEHGYEHGVLKSTRHLQSGGLPYPFFDLDQTIDPNTGLVSASRDVTGLGTTFRYDALGRITEEHPATGHGAVTTYEYTKAADPSTLASVIARERGNPNTQQVLQSRQAVFDGLGRQVQDRIDVPGHLPQFTSSNFNAQGWRLSVTERGTTTHRTEFLEHDAFGRPRRIRPPDGSAHDVTLEYDGIRVVRRTVTIKTQDRTVGEPSPPEEAATTTEVYDRQGTLHQVNEPSGDGGALTETRYSYDPGGRLTRVEVRGKPAGGSFGFLQERRFSYDGRGFLLSQQHPEKGVFGNGVVRYREYDALGHAGEVEDGETLTFAYDRAERLSTIRWKRSPTTTVPLKAFHYGASNSGTNRRLGRIVETERHNYVDWAGTGEEALLVTETFEYRGRDGRISRRETLFPDGHLRQDFTYHPLGGIEDLTYPCLLEGGSCRSRDPSRVLTHRYTSGFLTGVAYGDGHETTLSYHPNGLLHQIDFKHPEVYTLCGDVNGMARPQSIGVNLTCPSTDGLVYGYDGAGNVTRVAGSDYTYDKVSRVVYDAFANRSNHQRYRYDPVGNLTEIRTAQEGAPLDIRPLPTSHSTNRLTQHATYDASGNLTAYLEPGELVLRYDGLNMATEVSSGGSDFVFLYTADDERLIKRRRSPAGLEDVLRVRDLGASVLREYRRSAPAGLILSDDFESGDLRFWEIGEALETGEELAEKSFVPPWSFERDYIYRNGLLLSTVDEERGRLDYYLNHLGTPAQVSTGSGVVVEGGEFLFAFGEKPPSSTTEPAIELRFTGHERDESGVSALWDDLDYMHARFYSPHLGRFLSFDPVGGNPGGPQSWNRYAYVLGNPIKLIDPTGLLGEPAGVYFDTITVTASRPALTILAGIGATYNTLAYFGGIAVDFGFLPGERLASGESGSFSLLPGCDFNCQILREVASLSEGFELLEFGVITAASSLYGSTVGASLATAGAATTAARGPASVDELISMMNKRPGTTAEFATGDASRYLSAVHAEGSHLLLEGGRSHILLQRGVATRLTALHEWLHRRLQRQFGGPRPGEDLLIETFLERHKRFFRLGD